jgi:hypothetical protein
MRQTCELSPRRWSATADVRWFRTLAHSLITPEIREVLGVSQSSAALGAAREIRETVGKVEAGEAVGPDISHSRNIKACRSEWED